MRKYITVLLLCLSLVPITACDTKTITCEDGYENVDGQCEWIRTDFEQKIDNTTALKNYTLTITVTLGDETSVMTIKFEDTKSSITYGHVLEYFSETADKLYHYEQTLEGYSKTEVTKNSLDIYHFYQGLFERDFTVVNGKYLLNYGTYEHLTTFAESFDDDATYENVTLAVGEQFISEIKLDIRNDDQVYKLTMVLSDYNQTEVEVPTV